MPFQLTLKRCILYHVSRNRTAKIDKSLFSNKNLGGINKAAIQSSTSKITRSSCLQHTSAHHGGQPWFESKQPKSYRMQYSQSLLKQGNTSVVSRLWQIRITTLEIGRITSLNTGGMYPCHTRQVKTGATSFAKQGAKIREWNSTNKPSIQNQFGFKPHSFIKINSSVTCKVSRGNFCHRVFSVT